MEAQIKKLQENFYTDLEELKNKQREVNKTSAEMKSTLEGINSRNFWHPIFQVTFLFFCASYSAIDSL